MLLHSLLGSVTIGTLLGLIVTVWVYPVLVSSIFHVDKKKLESKCKISFAVFFSVIIGILSHVLLDVTNHPYNPLFWPFIPTTATPSPIYFAFGTTVGYLWIQVIMAAVLSVLIIIKRKNLFEELLVG